MGREWAGGFGALWQRGQTLIDEGQIQDNR